MDESPKWVLLGFFSSVLSADIARESLEAAEIPVLVKSNHPGLWGGAFQGTVVGGVELLVPDAALEAALEILGGDDTPSVEQRRPRSM
jgi:hypothetical protein